VGKSNGLDDAEGRERNELVFSIVGAGAPCLFTSGFDCERGKERPEYGAPAAVSRPVRDIIRSGDGE